VAPRPLKFSIFNFQLSICNQRVGPGQVEAIFEAIHALSDICAEEPKSFAGVKNAFAVIFGDNTTTGIL
jgi:hypothetical protein